MSCASVLRWAAWAALAAVAWAPSASASTADLAVDHVSLEEGAALEARCRVVHFLGRQAGDGATLTIAGETLWLELDTMWSNTSAAGVGAQREYATSSDAFRNGTFSVTAFRAHHAVFLSDLQGRAAPTLQWAGAPGRLEPSPNQTIVQPDRPTEGRPERSIDVGGAVSWTPSPGWTSLSATGDFYLALWEVDGQASGGGQTASYTTGETSEGPTSGILPPSLAVGRVEDRLLHVLAFNATLEWRFDTDGLLAFHVDDAEVDSDVPILLSGATGALRGGGSSLAVHDSEVRVASGRIESLRAAGAGLFVRLVAPDDAVSLDGQAVVWPRPEGTPRWAAVAAAAALAVGLAMAWRWSRSGLGRLERVMDRGLYADVVARRGRIGARHVPQANVLHAVSLLALQRHDEAGRFLEGLAAGERPEPPTFSYLLAAARAGEGKTAEAARLVRDCLAAAPEYLPEVVANASLLPLLQAHGRPRPLREGAEGGG